MVSTFAIIIGLAFSLYPESDYSGQSSICPLLLVPCFDQGMDQVADWYDQACRKTQSMLKSDAAVKVLDLVRSYDRIGGIVIVF